MLREVVAGLQPRPGGRYIDGTLGAGGHAAAILEASAPDGRLLGVDRDPQATRRAARALRRYAERVCIVKAPFTELPAIARRRGFVLSDGILLDLGVSSDQIADPARGFSFMADGPLDMRFDPTSGVTAAELVNTLPESELAHIIFAYGEERRSRRIARAIVAARPLQSTAELATTVARALGQRRGRLHPATRTFQALRIAVNDELGAIQQALPLAMALLAPGGRLAVLSYHSLEDRIVKQSLRDATRGCLCPPELPECRCGHAATVRLVARRAIRPSAAEAVANPRSRSARLRLAERLGMPLVSGVDS